MGQGFTLPRLPFQVPSQELASAPKLACADNSVAVRIATDRKPRQVVMDSLSERRKKKFSNTQTDVLMLERPKDAEHCATFEFLLHVY
jgi:hypothetical protein